MCSLQVFGKITQHVHSLICQMLTGRLSADRHSRSWLWIQFQDYLILPTFKDCSHPYTVGLNTQAHVCCHNSHSLTYRAPGRGAYPPQALQEASGAAEGGHALGSEVCASLVWAHVSLLQAAQGGYVTVSTFRGSPKRDPGLPV